MHLALAAFGFDFEMDARLTIRNPVIYIETRKHSFAWGREEWFEGDDGKWRHWIVERKDQPRAAKPLDDGGDDLPETA